MLECPTRRLSGSARSLNGILKQAEGAVKRKRVSSRFALAPLRLAKLPAYRT
jgi:hypothetical protein